MFGMMPDEIFRVIYPNNSKKTNCSWTIISPVWLCQQNSWNRNLSILRVNIISEPTERISFKFWLLLPLGQTPRHIFFVFFFFYEHFSFSLTWDPMGAKISKCYSSYKLQPKVFKLFLTFLPNGSRKTTRLEFLKFWKFNEFYSFSLTYDSMGVKISNDTPANHSQKFSNFSWIFLPMFLTKLRLRFLKFWVSDF